MTIRFDELPTSDEEAIRQRFRPSRRGLLKTLAAGGMALGLGALTWVNDQGVSAEAAYFKDYKDTGSGPCTSYARLHTEHGLRCGPSTICSGYACCWKYASGADNQKGWHRRAPGIGGSYYLHRPDQGWSGGYDSWRWKFSDGKTYRCSDGYTCSSKGSCYKSICPWSV